MAGKRSRVGFNKKTTKEEEKKGAKHNRRQDILSNKSEGPPGSGTSRNREIIMTGTGAHKKETPRKASISERQREHRRRRKAGESTHDVITKGKGVVARRNPSR